MGYGGGDRQIEGPTATQMEGWMNFWMGKEELETQQPSKLIKGRTDE